MPPAPVYDVLVLGEVLVEIHADTALRTADDGTAARISYSGDALNAAAAAAAAGARTALLAVVGDDELSAPLLSRAADLGVDVSHVLLARVAPLAGLLKSSCPADALALVDTDDPPTAAARYRALGARTVAVTAGPGRLLLHDGDRAAYHPVPVDPAPVDATGAGDCFTGTTTARLALGDTLADAVAYGMAAASLSVSGRGGTGHVPAFTETAALAAAHRRTTAR
ncbi:carbohydrate kinase family protein [Streptomyces sp. NPDC003042]